MSAVEVTRWVLTLCVGLWDLYIVHHCDSTNLMIYFTCKLYSRFFYFSGKCPWLKRYRWRVGVVCMLSCLMLIYQGKYWCVSGILSISLVKEPSYVLKHCLQQNYTHTYSSPCFAFSGRNIVKFIKKKSQWYLLTFWWRTIPLPLKEKQGDE